MKPRDFLAVIVVAGLTAAATALPPLDVLDDIALDSLHWLRQAAFGPKYKPQQSPTVVIAIDEETFQTPPYKNLPKIMWSKQLASIINSVVDGGAKVIGFDLIFPTSVERLLPNFEREFRISLFKASRKNKIILGKVQHSAKPVSPHPAQAHIVGGQKNMRAVNAFEDNDGIIRHMPLSFQAVNQDKSIRTESSMSLELAVRALGNTWQGQPGSEYKLGDWTIPGSISGNIALNFEAGNGDIPTYSFADLAACAAGGNKDYFNKHFKDKVVILGTVLDVEDRKLTSKRFVTGVEGTTFTDRCVLPVKNELYKQGVTRDMIAGVYIHATAVNNLIRQDALRKISRGANGLIVLAVALVAGLMTLTLAPIAGGVGVGGVILIWTGLATVLFNQGVAVSLFDPALAAIMSFGLLLGYRFAVADKDKRYIRKVFSYYLPPTVIEQMTSDDQLPTLGGESKEITIFFSDIAKFSTLSEALTAAEVATFLNEYLTEMSDLIEDRGGFIEKFVADEITGVFGAPLDNPDHAFFAVDTALACDKRLAEMKGAFGLPADSVLQARIGVNTGEMLVGNIGSRRRFNYAAMGDAANLGSRLEGANKFFDTMMMVGERTHELIGERIVFREVDTILVMGRETPVRCFEPLGYPGEVSDERLAIKSGYEAALAVYRDRKFAEAARLFGELNEIDPTAKILAARCTDYVENPPPEDWKQAFILGGK